MLPNLLYNDWLLSNNKRKAIISYRNLLYKLSSVEFNKSVIGIFGKDIEVTSAQNVSTSSRHASHGDIVLNKQKSCNLKDKFI